MKSIRSRSFRLASQAIAVTAIAAVAAAPAHAAILSYRTQNDVVMIYLKAGWGGHGGNLNGKFDSIDFDLTTGPGTTLTNISSGAGHPAGDPFTYRNRILDADPLDGGLGWSIVGASITPTAFKFVGGPLGSTIDTGAAVGNGLFLANLRLASDRPFSARIAGSVKLLSAGQILADIPFIPEPAAGTLSVFALLALRAASRQSRSAS